MPYFDPAFPPSDEDFYGGLAADIVQKLAPTPTPIPPATTVDAATLADYEAKAERAERLLYDYLSSTQGAALTSVSGDAGSLSFANQAEVKSIVRMTMGTYYKSRLRTSLLLRG